MAKSLSRSKTQQNKNKNKYFSQNVIVNQITKRPKKEEMKKANKLLARKPEGKLRKRTNPRAAETKTIADKQRVRERRL